MRLHGVGHGLIFLVQVVGARRLRKDLRLAGVFQEIHPQESNRTVRPHGQRAVIAQHQQRLVAQIVDDTFPLVQLQRDALIVVIGQIVVHDHRELRIAPQPAVLHRHGHTVGRVHMDHTARIMARRVNGRMDGETRRIDVVRRILTDVALKVDLDQRRRRHFIEHHAVWVDQEPLGPVLVRQARRDVGEHQIGPAVHRAQTVGSGKLATQRPFLLRDFAFQRRHVHRIRHVLDVHGGRHGGGGVFHLSLLPESCVLARSLNTSSAVGK